MDKKKRSESVGYRHPPKQNQFQPGRSGNPSGKKKGLRSMSAELQDILNEQVTFAADGALKTMSKQRALASSLISAAIAGDLRATAIVMTHLGRDGHHAGRDDSAIEADEFAAVRSHRQRTKGGEL